MLSAIYWGIESALGLYENFPTTENWEKVKSAIEKAATEKGYKKSVVNQLINDTNDHIRSFASEMTDRWEWCKSTRGHMDPDYDAEEIDEMDKMPKYW